MLCRMSCILDLSNCFIMIRFTLNISRSCITSVFSLVNHSHQYQTYYNSSHLEKKNKTSIDSMSLPANAPIVSFLISETSLQNYLYFVIPFPLLFSTEPIPSRLSPPPLHISSFSKGPQRPSCYHIQR